MTNARLRNVMVAFGVFALVAACTTYGEDPATNGEAPGETLDDGGGAPGRDASAPSGDGSTSPPDDAAVPGDAGPDATPGYAEACPPCPRSSTCIGAGCSGGASFNSCERPFDVGAGMTAVAFVCPESPTVNFPQACVPGGGTKDLHVAIFRMGISPGPKGDWKVNVKGANAFVSSGPNCTTVLNCSGGTDGPSQPRAVDKLTTVMIGTTNVLTSCQQLMVTFTAE